MLDPLPTASTDLVRLLANCWPACVKLLVRLPKNELSPWLMDCPRLVALPGAGDVPVMFEEFGLLKVAVRFDKVCPRLAKGVVTLLFTPVAFAACETAP